MKHHQSFGKFLNDDDYDETDIKYLSRPCMDSTCNFSDIPGTFNRQLWLFQTGQISEYSAVTQTRYSNNPFQKGLPPRYGSAIESFHNKDEKHYLYTLHTSNPNKLFYIVNIEGKGYFHKIIEYTSGEKLDIDDVKKDFKNKVFQITPEDIEKLLK